MDDLCSVGTVALLEACGSLEFYFRKRIQGAMVDHVRGANYVAATRSCSIGDVTADDRPCRPEFVVPAHPILESIDAKRRRDRVAVAIEVLPEPEREVVAARMAGENVIDFAARRGVSKRTVMRRQATAIGMIRSSVAAA